MIGVDFGGMEATGLPKYLHQGHLPKYSPNKNMNVDCRITCFNLHK